MLTTQREIDTVADRIEKAYRAQRRDWDGVCSTQRVWSVAAANLLRAESNCGFVAVDPELFVASQKGYLAFPDPWEELTVADAVCRYQRRLRQIVRSLQRELAAEVKLAEDRVEAGQDLAKVLGRPSRRISALGRYIVARRAGCFTLSAQFLTGSLEQHRSCPLYQLACADLLPAGSGYPDMAFLEVQPRSSSAGVRPKVQSHLN